MSQPVSAEKFSVVILYERLTYVGKAMSTYLHLRRELIDDYATDFRLWRMDVALTPECWAEAERDIARAALIIVAVDGHRPCPAAFQRWQDGAVRNGSLAPHAIIGLVQGADEPGPGSWSSILRRVATQIHPEIFVCESGHTELQTRPAPAEPRGRDRGLTADAATGLRPWRT